MSKYSSINDTAFLEQVKNWIDLSGEIYVNVGFFRSGGAGSIHIICTSYDSFTNILNPLQEKKGTVTILRQPNFKIRGVANESLLKQAMSIFLNGEDWFLICPNEKSPYDSFGSGDRTHSDMRESFGRVEGRFVVMGDDKDFPPDEDRDDVLVARFNI
jgi:hypothetical protein